MKLRCTSCGVEATLDHPIRLPRRICTCGMVIRTRGDLEALRQAQRLADAQQRASLRHAPSASRATRSTSPHETSRTWSVAPDRERPPAIERYLDPASAAPTQLNEHADLREDGRALLEQWHQSGNDVAPPSRAGFRHNIIVPELRGDPPWCPCGCGARPRLLRRTAAAGYARTIEAAMGLESIRILAQYLEEQTWSPQSDNTIAGLVDRSLAISRQWLEHCHKTATPVGTPDMLALTRATEAIEGSLAKALSAFVED